MVLQWLHWSKCSFAWVSIAPCLLSLFIPPTLLTFLPTFSITLWSPCNFGHVLFYGFGRVLLALLRFFRVAEEDPQAADRTGLHGGEMDIQASSQQATLNAGPHELQPSSSSSSAEYAHEGRRNLTAESFNAIQLTALAKLLREQVSSQRTSLCENRYRFDNAVEKCGESVPNRQTCCESVPIFAQSGLLVGSYYSSIGPACTFLMINHIRQTS